MQAVELLRSGKVDVVPIISHRLPLEGLAPALELLGSQAAGVRKVIIEPNG
jgi:threonine dehydrogenase-like Zn-dependent dehydrogenase